ncbi:MAG TPA: hypothetical protein DDZ56_05930, partial [Cytophagales bacterium]|nr:hypothetical protein [Cytophagales bacterium]
MAGKKQVTRLSDARDEVSMGSGGPKVLFVTTAIFLTGMLIFAPPETDFQAFYCIMAEYTREEIRQIEDKW